MSTRVPTTPEEQITSEKMFVAKRNQGFFVSLQGVPSWVPTERRVSPLSVPATPKAQITCRKRRRRKDKRFFIPVQRVPTRILPRHQHCCSILRKSCRAQGLQAELTQPARKHFVQKVVKLVEMPSGDVGNANRQPRPVTFCFHANNSGDAVKVC